MASFSSQVGAWASESEERLAAVRRRAVSLLGEEMSRTRPQGGAVPFDTGNLARSLMASTVSMPMTSATPSHGGSVGAVAATLELSDPVWLGYQAIYARRVNYGLIGADSMGRVYNQSGAHFVEAAVARWGEIVEQAVREVSGGAA